MRPTPAARRLLIAARLCCAAGALGTLGTGCTHLREQGCLSGESFDPMTRALGRSEGIAAPGELADDVFLYGPEAGTFLPGSPALEAGAGCPSCGPGGCGAGCPLAAANRPTSGPALVARRAIESGHAAERANRPDLAQDHYRRALRSDPSAVEAHHRLAVLLDQTSSYAAAEQHYEAALAARPGDVDLLCDVGYSFLLQGRVAEAEDRFRTALAQEPDHLRCLENLGLLYAKQGDRTRAAAVLARTGTKAEVEAKLAVLFPSKPPSRGPVVPTDAPLWAGLTPDTPVPTVAAAPSAAPPVAAKYSGSVRAAAVASPGERPISLLMTPVSPVTPAVTPAAAVGGPAAVRTAEARSVPQEIEPPHVPPPAPPTGDLTTWQGLGGAPASGAPASGAAEELHFEPGIGDGGTFVPAAAGPKSSADMPLWPPVGGFSAAR
ncbi:tetratricopeptide repeat protein [Alienimonas californiensis]|uniref:Tetratricopeptide repeat protein n=1 Tax=Alienimonas californiensis TaxID=2527989 RepID=A0A517PA62_9PLAN|nr:tetratricopeptide repeat protein [Alienimonas californiensis]QDT16266.1 Tetratricopeptide repeat protein [Alienimonas californiensis]